MAVSVSQIQYLNECWSHIYASWVQRVAQSQKFWLLQKPLRQQQISQVFSTCWDHADRGEITEGC